MTKATIAARPALNRAGFDFKLGDEVGRRLEGVTRNWLLPTPLANPRILEMFRERDIKPYFNQVPWAGEFAGKFLTSCVQILRLTGDADLRSHIDWFVGELVLLQADDGYLGPWPKEFRLKKGAPTCAEPWDTWGHYHAMIGLMLWHEMSGDARALVCSRRIADLFCARFLNGTEKMHDTGVHEINLAPVHSLGILHRITGEPRYLALAEKIEGEFAIEPAGDYTNQALAGKPFWQTPKPRWESLHPIMGLAELYYITGNKKFRTAFESLWWSMLEGDRHNNGGFTSGEKATGNPYDTGAIETCCTVAWSAMSVEMLRMTASPVVADELELALVNSGYGMMSPGGRWVTYDTPMEGSRAASAHTIVFQARPGQPELNCCSVNGPRILGLVGEWALMSDAAGALHVNFFGPGVFRASLASGAVVAIEQETRYPRDGKIAFTLRLAGPEKFKLCLRIPHWSRNTAAAVNGKPVGKKIKPVAYLALNRTWRDGDQIMLDLDMSLHYWINESHIDQLEGFEPKWRVFGPAPRTQAESAASDSPPAPVFEPAIETITKTPDSLTINGQSFKGVDVVSKHGELPLSEWFPPRNPLPSFVAVTQIRSKSADSMRISFSADWWVEFFVNGKSVYSNVASGGNLATLELRKHEFRMPLAKGVNTLAVKIFGGSQRGAWVSIGHQRVSEKNAGDGFQAHASIYRGPVLLAFDQALNPEASGPAMFDAAGPLQEAESPRGWLKPWMLWRTHDVHGRPMLLCDFASAGVSGSVYRTWLPVKFGNHRRAKFSRTNPLRSAPAK